MIWIFGSLLQLAVISSCIFLDVCLLNAVLHFFFCKATLSNLGMVQALNARWCPPNYFKNDTSVDCMPCPEGSTAPNGSTSHENCKCKVGELFEKNGELKLDRTKDLTTVRFLSCLMFVGVSWMFNLNKCATKLYKTAPVHWECQKGHVTVLRC